MLVWLDFFLAENFEITMLKVELENATIIQQLLKIVQQTGGN